MENDNEIGVEIGKRDIFNGTFFDEGNLTPYLSKKFEDYDECDSFLCDECTADIDAENLWVCDGIKLLIFLCIKYENHEIKFKMNVIANLDFVTIVTMITRLVESHTILVKKIPLFKSLMCLT